MSNYIVESTISLAILFFFYKFFLESEKTYQFNRFYLLASLLISLIIPFISIEIFNEIQNIPTAPEILNERYIPNSITPKKDINYGAKIALTLYFIVAIILVIRFINNLWTFRKKIKQNPHIRLHNATIILLDENAMPYTFLNFVFVNKQNYKNKRIQPELLEHEFTHIHQKHSYDILFIEIIKIIFWFNPMFSLYKKALQLNHEFIADENVIKKHKNVSLYQHLLLNTIETKKYYLASNLNYLMTKKRFIMMTKKTSRLSAILKRATTLPVLTLLIYFLCVDLVAQEKEKTETSFPHEDVNKYYEDVQVITQDRTGNVISTKKYNELSEDEKKMIPPPPPVPLKIKMTQAQFEDFKKQAKYAIWIDGTNVDNSELNKFKPSDFVFFQNSHVYKNARSKKFPQENQVNLYTETGYKEAFEKRNKKAGGTIVIRNK
ncbi:hypothetical protein GOQ30_07135 [Flavobacterium sp. TP390]|uniref:Peptidase M56 domain-containing protein n=1 Tax=Flavobacterium profundi TaxID=1774945 RepID=A0A6I4ISF8_9FLAO|nr:M56 family metallopeptidase [Flavobacterium profundi]MVO08937.1 hypothetical protein [Flavobacterium profundi]